MKWHQERFEFYIEAYSQTASLFDKELTRMVAIAVVSDDVHNIQEKQDPIHQLRTFLKWFKDDFFKWVVKPVCTNCNSDENMT